MYQLLYTPNAPFDMSDWEKKKITKVFAGMNCVIAITETGETLQKIRDIKRLYIPKRLCRNNCED